jgi:hypothetical protein
MKIFLNNPLVLLSFSVETISLIKDCIFIPAELRLKVANKVAKEIILSPPSWISIIIIVFPFNVKHNDVSTTTRPVTQHALVEVNRASIKLMPETVISGRSNKPAPDRIRNIKDIASNAEGPTFI